MVSPRAIRFARAMALVSQSLPVPTVTALTALAAAASVAACQPPPEPIMGQLPYPLDAGAPGPSAAPDAGLPPEHRVGTMSGPEEVHPGEHVAPEKK